jgi:indole-3-glycerol phosphate synthase/phosphoribosylanthranilate isomerase
VSTDDACLLVQRARQNGQRPVGVFRHWAVAEVADAAANLDLHAVQLHGDYERAEIEAVRRRVPAGCEIWTALSTGRDRLIGRGGDRLLFDNGDGGTGRGFDWALIEKHPDLPQALVAGGIGPDNARSAQELGAYAIDLCSSVEERPGLKSIEKIEALFETLRPNAREGVLECA